MNKIYNLFFVVLTILWSCGSIFSQSIVKRSKVCGYTHTYEMTVTGHGSDTLTISNIGVTSIASDLVFVYSVDGSFDIYNNYSWDANGTFWFVYFDPGHNPVKLANGGGSGEFSCDCTGTGGCEVVSTSNGLGCTNTDCNECCDEKTDDIGPISAAGGGILIKGDVVILNGTTFD